MCDQLTTIVERLLDRVERLELSQKERGNTRKPERFPREVTKKEMTSGRVGDVAEWVTYSLLFLARQFCSMFFFLPYIFFRTTRFFAYPLRTHFFASR